ncbi:ABC transporter [Rhodothalassium salexigens]|uniref:ABC transporter ATP-binding protein n=1 Tax=Rhodothalassium salexigens TaxID=1086 RepID=UPI001911920A|nr:ATP-binding cassette domain-containing protein [Rhodothalassium salexigens]MBK5911078.1 ABC transporter [Rhodothalassium salexigens]MBK5920029.1 ABC transporter [Rhodothalassium salexigens]
MTATSPSRPADPIIALGDVHLKLDSGAGPVHILRGLDLAVGAGQAVGLVGPSGSGKSSLMAIMSGLEAATSGRVSVDGHDLSALDEDALALLRRNRIGIVLQSFHLIPTMTALENVAVPLELARRDDAFAEAAAALDRVGLGHRLDHYPAQLSGGEQQRVALARAVAPGPAVLLADEPTGNLDSGTGQTIIDLMFSLHDERDATLVLITHDLDLANRCDRVVHIADGRITHEEPGRGARPVGGTAGGAGLSGRVVEAG